MGYAARSNPYSAEGSKALHDVQRARLSAFLDHFPTRAAYEQYLIAAEVADPQELAALEDLLPTRLQAQASV